jgi:RimJ/RimL family protein N-acetyltransferase
MDSQPATRTSSVRFSTTRTDVHALDPEDDRAVHFVADALNDPHVFKTYSDEGREPLTAADVRATFDGRDTYAFVARATGSDEYVGVVEASRIDRRRGSALFGTFVARKYQNSGYGVEITAPVVDWLFETLRMHRVWTIVGENADTNSIIDVDGFEREGVMRDADYIDGEYVDRHVIGCLEDGWQQAKDDIGDYLATFLPDDALYPRLPSQDSLPGDEDPTDAARNPAE